MEVSDTEVISLKNDLRLALQRITDLQHAMEEGDSGQSDRYFNWRTWSFGKMANLNFLSS